MDPAYLSTFLLPSFIYPGLGLSWLKQQRPFSLSSIQILVTLNSLGQAGLGITKDRSFWITEAKCSHLNTEIIILIWSHGIKQVTFVNDLGSYLSLPSNQHSLNQSTFSVPPNRFWSSHNYSLCKNLFDQNVEKVILLHMIQLQESKWKVWVLFNCTIC